MTDPIKKIVITGPESTGKSTLTKELAQHYHTVSIPEYARYFVENLKRPYQYADIEHIARMQIEELKQFQAQANNYLFLDTYLIITKVWFDFAFGKAPHWLIQHLKKNEIDLFLLCSPDLPWIPDSVRENGGEMRMKLFDIYKNELEDFGFNYKIIEGFDETRKSNAINAIDSFFGRADL
jgi:NadR type nicotinamide-nucleotide adenylyltransferase